MASDVGNIQIGIEFDVVGQRDVVSMGNSIEHVEKKLIKLHQRQRQGIISDRAFRDGKRQLKHEMMQVTGQMIKSQTHMQRLNATLGKLDDQSLMAARAQNQLGMSMSRSQTAMKRFASVGLQQVGYQVSDFVVQVQSGTNALVAFGQQGSQLAGLLFRFRVALMHLLPLVSRVLSWLASCSLFRVQWVS